MSCNTSHPILIAKITNLICSNISLDQTSLHFTSELLFYFININTTLLRDAITWICLSIYLLCLSTSLLVIVWKVGINNNNSLYYMLYCELNCNIIFLLRLHLHKFAQICYITFQITKL